MSERIKDIGEFALIERIHDLLNREGLRSERVTLGIGDDTASFLPAPDMSFWSPAIAWSKDATICPDRSAPWTWGVVP